MNFSPIAAAWKAGNAVLSIVPPPVWAIALALAGLYGGIVTSQRDVAQAALTELQTKVNAMQIAAAQRLKDKTQEAQALRDALNEYHRNQEKRDAQNKSVVDGYARRLAVAGRLRDPGWSGGGCPAGEGASGAVGGDGNRADAGGVLSERLTGVLLDLVLKSDTINIAYRACRDDERELRARIKSLGSCLLPEPEAANHPAR